MTDALLEIDHLEVELGHHVALHDVVLEVPAGGSVGIVGETGSGKSLTCRAILGLLGRIGGRISGGKASFGGIDLAHLDRGGWQKIRGRRIGFVPQASLGSLDPVMRVGQQLEETVRAIDPGAEPKARCIELLEAVQMPGAAEVAVRYPHELSGGMRQRVMIALALAGRPELLVADEATTALDVTIQRTILDLLSGLRAELQMALVIVTHDLAVAEAVCETLTVMYAGSTIESGPLANVRASPAHPYTRALLGAQLTPDWDGKRLPAISGRPPELGEPRDGCPFVPRCEYASDVCRGAPLILQPIATDHRVACRRAESLT